MTFKFIQLLINLMGILVVALKPSLNVILRSISKSNWHQRYFTDGQE